MMRFNKALSFTYDKYKNPLKGLLWSLYNYLDSESYFNTFHILYSSCYSSDYLPKYAIDFSNNYWTAKDEDDSPEIGICLPFNFLLEGYSIGNADKSLHLKSWYFSVSKSRDNYFINRTLCIDEHQNLNKKNGTLYTEFHVPFPIRCIKIEYNSIYPVASNSHRFDLSQIELFGTIAPNNLCSCFSFHILSVLPLFYIYIII